MNNKEFLDCVEKSYFRSIVILTEKEKEYSQDNNRLIQFYESSAITNTNPCEALIGMATKHFTSIAYMAKNPSSFSLDRWDEKITDLRNYTFLLDALLRDMGIE